MASGAAAAPPVQTVVLRVSIHCHGCKKKVRKVLRSIEGVQSVTVDAAQHKVTVTGTVDANTLVQRLHKSGKKGVPWNCHPPADKTGAAPVNKTEAAPAPAPAAAAKAATASDDAGKDAAAATVAAAAAAADKKPEPKAESPEKKKPEEAVKEAKAESPEKKKPEEAVKEPKAESPEKKKPEEAVKEPKAESPEKKKPEAESKAEKKVEAKKEGGDGDAAEPKAKAAEPAKEEAKEAVAAAASASTKDENEAKKAKDDKPNKDAGKAEPAAVTERSLSAPPPLAPKHAYYEEEYRYPYYPAPQPVLSYHASQPSASVSYFAPHPQQQAAYSMQQPPPQPQAAYSTHQPPPQQMQQWAPSYLYLPYPHAAPDPYHHQQDYYSPPGMHVSPPPMQDSYRIFDDENPNSCSVM